MNPIDENTLSGIRYGLKHVVPELTRSIQSSNILKAMELDYELQLGIFSKEEQSVIIKSEKDMFLNHNKDIKRMVKGSVNRK